MSFLNKCSTIIRRANKDMFYIHLENGIIFDYFDSDNNLISSMNLTKNKLIDFTKAYFTLDKYDNIYGVYNSNNSLIMVDILNNSSEILEKEIISYNNKKFNISFPYIKKDHDSLHIIYYVYNNDSTNTSAIFHHYKHNGIWTENKIDFVNHIVMDNFIVIWSQQSPIIFYFNLVDGCEELFLSRFNCSTLSWSNPIQVTNSNKNKIYLSVLKDNMNFYHVSYCENIGNGYAVKYLNGYLNESNMNVNISTYITGPSTCMYPSLIKENTRLYLMWVNYNRLVTCSSDDLGKTWSDHETDDFSIEEDFVRARFFSNYKNDMPYNVSSIFTTSNDVGILGF